MSYKVLFINPLKDYIDGLRAATPQNCELVVLPSGTSVERLCAEAADADFIISGIDVPEEVFRAAKQAKFIQYMSSGYGQLPLAVVNDLGIPVAQMKTHSISVAEHAVTLILSLLRRIPASMHQLREGKWREDLDESSHAELYGKTVGIVGLGNIGRWVGKVVHHGFGANVIYYDNAEIPLTVSELISARSVPLDELVSESDVVCVSLPLNEGTNLLIGQEELSLMKNSAVLVNVGRGEVIDEKALIQLLRERRIAGAGLDVYAREPLDLSSELLDLESVICTPHMAGVGWENVQRRIATVWENIDTALRGQVPRGVITDVKRAPAPQLS
ncbi:NAD(P)-dependent oxidoreductase [Glutamicibacter ardleyensis]|uniref:NAD(P)-dependent oxidoreductase n=1 Tax=Glutamicibacter ardleyensis TaxID=225894 RepID=UPI003FD50EB0